jgi:TRAP-type mannitol/chloroaromatic compound transport system permease small subunit
MKPAHRNGYDSHPKLTINTQILWIIAGTGLLYRWLPRTVDSWQAGETYNLPQGIAYSVIGVVLVLVGFVLVNSAINRLVSKIPSDPDPSESERIPLSPPNTL